MLISSNTQYHGKSIVPEEIHQDRNKKQIVIGYLGRGESFGEHSALNDLPNPFSVEAFT